MRRHARGDITDMTAHRTGGSQEAAALIRTGDLVKQVLAPSYSNLYATMDNEDMRKMLEAMLANKDKDKQGYEQ
jgi:hypothetical protein